MLKAKPDFLMIGASGAMTLQSPQIFRHLSLRTLQKVTSLPKDAGVPSLLHSCGMERALVEICANETDLSCIEPLEIPPMGDCDLAEIKRKFGGRLALKGNIHTTDVMLRGTPEDVRRESRRCIEAAAEGGGFVLSTGDVLLVAAASAGLCPVRLVDHDRVLVFVLRCLDCKVCAPAIWWDAPVCQGPALVPGNDSRRIRHGGDLDADQRAHGRPDSGIPMAVELDAGLDPAWKWAPLCCRMSQSRRRWRAWTGPWVQSGRRYEDHWCMESLPLVMLPCHRASARM